MGRFTDPLVVQKVISVRERPFLRFWTIKKRNQHWLVVKPFKYHVGHKDSTDIVYIPQKYRTDFASVPRFFWRIFPPDGFYTQAAVLHDYICEHERGIRSQKEIDLIFLEAMEVLRVPAWKRHTMYRAVWVAQRLKCLKEGRDYGKTNA